MASSPRFDTAAAVSFCDCLTARSAFRVHARTRSPHCIAGSSSMPARLPGLDTADGEVVIRRLLREAVVMPADPGTVRGAADK